MSFESRERVPIAVGRETLRTRWWVSDQDPEPNGLWRCDIAFQSQNVYNPFARLVLVRFQPHSIDGCHISSPTPTESFQPAGPDRSAVRRPHESEETHVDGSWCRPERSSS